MVVLYFAFAMACSKLTQGDKLTVLAGNKGRDYIGILFPFSLLRTSRKFYGVEKFSASFLGGSLDSFPNSKLSTLNVGSLHPSVRPGLMQVSSYSQQP